MYISVDVGIMIFMRSSAEYVDLVDWERNYTFL